MIEETINSVDYKDKQETIRRVVRALRIALTILEGDDETVVPHLKKAD